MAILQTVVSTKSDSIRPTANGLNMVRLNISRLVNSPVAWKATYSNNRSMDCLANSNPCMMSNGENGRPQGQGNGLRPAANRPFALYDGTTTAPYYDATDPKSGFTIAGAPCNEFSTYGHASCVFRYDLVWTANCNPGACTDPPVTVSANLRYSPLPNARPLVINLSNFAIGGITRAAR